MCLKRLQHMKALAEQGVSSVPAALPSDACQLQSTNGHCLQSCLVLMCLHFSPPPPTNAMLFTQGSCKLSCRCMTVTAPMTHVFDA